MQTGLLIIKTENNDPNHNLLGQILSPYHIQNKQLSSPAITNFIYTVFTKAAYRYADQPRIGQIPTLLSRADHVCIFCTALYLKDPSTEQTTLKLAVIGVSLMKK